MFAFLANRRLTAQCAKNASRHRSLGKWQVDRWLSCPCRSPSHRTDYQVELVSVQLRRLVKVVEGDCAFFLSRPRRADFKRFALLLRTLATKPNLTSLTR